MRLTVFSVSYTDFVCQYRFCEVFVNCFPRVTHYNAITAYCQGDSIFYVCRFFSLRKSASFSLTSLVIPLFLFAPRGNCFVCLREERRENPKPLTPASDFSAPPQLIVFLRSAYSGISRAYRLFSVFEACFFNRTFRERLFFWF